MATREVPTAVGACVAREAAGAEWSAPQQIPPDLLTSIVDVIYALRLTPTLSYEYISPSVQAITGHAPADYYADASLGVHAVGRRGAYSTS